MKAPVSSKEGADQVTEYPDPLVGFVASVRDDVDPRGVVGGEGDGHGGDAVIGQYRVRWPLIGQYGHLSSTMESSCMSDRWKLFRSQNLTI